MTGAPVIVFLALRDQQRPLSMGHGALLTVDSILFLAILWTEVYTGLYFMGAMPFSRFLARRKAQRAAALALLIAPYVARGKQLLDVGCGHGYVGQALAHELEASLVGVDATDQREVHIPFVRAKGEALPFAADSFDTMLLTYVLHHAPWDNQSRMLAEAARVARTQVIVLEDVPRGRTERVIACLWDRILNPGKTPVPCAFRTVEEWRAAFAGAGLRIAHEQTLARAWSDPVRHVLVALSLREHVPRGQQPTA
jgi:SAM-dependent methyltransferase